MPKLLRVGTDCSGMETPCMALRALGVPYESLFACDINKHAKSTILANHRPRIFYDDLMNRDNSSAPSVDVYIAGFPCQPFSLAGKQQGFKDQQGRGTVLFGICRYLEAQRPGVFILENVGNLLRMDGGKVLSKVLSCLNSIGGGLYNVVYSAMDTQDHGVPQSRPRVYFIGILKSIDRGTFRFPLPLPRPSIDGFLEPRKSKPTMQDLPPKSQGTAHRNVKRILKELTDAGQDPLNQAFIIDCDSSDYRCKYMKDKTPCITRSRAAGHWVTSRGRRMTKKEMMALQGMESHDFKQVVSDCQLGAQIGNAMSGNVLERLFVRLLPAAGLYPGSRLVDRWEAAAASSSALPRKPGGSGSSSSSSEAQKDGRAGAPAPSTPPRRTSSAQLLSPKRLSPKRMSPPKAVRPPIMTRSRRAELAAAGGSPSKKVKV